MFQGEVTVEVAAAASETVYRTSAQEAELVVYADSGLGAGLGRYDRHSAAHAAFRVACHTAAGMDLLSD
jgi:hypothetical protein